MLDLGIEQRIGVKPYRAYERQRERHAQSQHGERQPAAPLHSAEIDARLGEGKGHDHPAGEIRLVDENYGGIECMRMIRTLR